MTRIEEHQGDDSLEIERAREKEKEERELGGGGGGGGGEREGHGEWDIAANLVQLREMTRI